MTARAGDANYLISAEKALEGKEVKTMKYEKPELTVVASAVAAVQGGKPSSSQFETSGSYQKTANAYEADE